MELSLPVLPGSGPFSVSRWRRQPGERVLAGEPLLEAHSAQFDWDIPASCDGVLESVIAAGAAVMPGDRLAVIRADEAAPARRLRMSPLAARLAAAHGIAAEGLAAGTERRIVRADVLAALQARETSADTIRPWTAAQRERAGRVTRMARDVPHGTITVVLDLSAVAAERAAVQAAWQRRERVPLDDLPFILHAAIAALFDVPECNATVSTDGLRLHRAVNAAIAIDDGISPPRAGVIANAERYNVVGMARRLAPLQPGGSLDGGTLTIRVRPALLATDLLADGQTAALNIGPVVARAVAVGDADAQIHPVAHVSLTYDKRAVSDAAAQRYTEFLAKYIGSV